MNHSSNLEGLMADLEFNVQPNFPMEPVNVTQITNKGALIIFNFPQITLQDENLNPTLQLYSL